MFEAQTHQSRLLGKNTLMLGTVGVLFVACIGLLFTVQHLATPPENFPVGRDVVITEGLTQSEITDLLKSTGVVRSSLYLYIRLNQLYPGEFVQAGVYQFSEPVQTDVVARSLVLGENRSPLLRFTLPEGFHAAELATYLPPELNVSSTETLKQLEGYLFPDTYFVSPKTTLEEILTLLEDNFDEKLQPLLGSIEASGFTLDEVLTLASILEREANDAASRKLVSGILQSRLDIGMPLQVDATFDYLLGKTSAELTEEDLEIDSPYNTYLYPGLPPGPIANPGLESILAVLEPTESDYLYYLTGKDGKFYYAETFEEHKRNKERYLR